MDPIRVGQFSLGGAQRVAGQQPSVSPTGAEPLATTAPTPAASVAGGVNELRSISSRIAEIERAGFQAMARRDELDDVIRSIDELIPLDASSVNGKIGDLAARIGIIEQQVGAAVPESSGEPTLVELRSRASKLIEGEQTAAGRRADTLSQLVAQMRGTVSAQTGATPADFNAAGAASALRQGLLGQPAPTPPPPSGGIEPRRSVELLTDRE